MTIELTAVLRGVTYDITIAEQEPPTSAPNNFTATPFSSTQINISFDSVPTATAYRLETSADGVSGWSVLQNDDIRSFSHTGLDPSTQYFYRVTALNGNGDGPTSAVINATTNASGQAPQTAPQNTGVVTQPTGGTGGQHMLNVYWDEVGDADTYQLQSSTDGGTNWTDVSDKERAGLKHFGIQAATTYTYRVRARNASGDGPWSANFAGTTLSATGLPPDGFPRSFGLSVITRFAAVDALWEPQEDALSYRLERAPEAAEDTPGTFAEVWSGVDTTYRDETAVAGTTYYYRLYGVNAAGDSAPAGYGSGYSGVVCHKITVPSTFDANAVPNVFAWGHTSDSIQTSWTFETGADQYRLERSPNGSTGWTEVVTHTVDRQVSPHSPFWGHHDKGLTANTEYFYRLVAIVDGSDVATSANFSGTTLAEGGDKYGSPVLEQVDVSEPTYSGTTTTLTDQGSDTANMTALQNAVDAASPGDIIELVSGADYRGLLELPVIANPGGDYILIRTARTQPTRGERIDPVVDGPGMARLVNASTNQPVMRCTSNARYFRFEDLKFEHEGALENGIINFNQDGARTQLSDYPHNLIVDRCWITGNGTQEARNGIRFNSYNCAAIECYIENITSASTDALALVCWATPGRLLWRNNYLSSTGENFLIGGARQVSDAATGYEIHTTDVEVIGNFCEKPLTWKSDDPSYGGINWVVKNLGELKHGERVLFEGNIFKNNWVDAQQGQSFLLTSRTKSGREPFGRIGHVLFQHNVMVEVDNGPNFSGIDSASRGASRYVNRNCVVYNSHWFASFNDGTTGGGNWFQLISRTDGTVLDRNTSSCGNSQLSGGGYDTEDDIELSSHTNFEMKNNVFHRSRRGIIMDGASQGNASFERYMDSVLTFENNYMLRGSAGDYPNPTLNTYPELNVPFAYPSDAGCDYTLLDARLSALNDTPNPAPQGVPATPTTVTIDNTVGSELTLTLGRTPWGRGYHIEWSGTDGSSGTQYRHDDQNTWTHSGLSDLETYTYDVYAINAEGVSATPQTVQASPGGGAVPPVTPADLTLTPGDGEVVVTWTDSDNADDYTISWTNNNPGSTTVVQGVGTYTITGLTNGTQVDVSITANNVAGSSTAATDSATPVDPGAAGALFNADFTGTAGTLITAYTPENDPSGLGLVFSSFGADGPYELDGAGNLATPALSSNDSSIKEFEYALDTPVPASYRVNYQFVFKGTGSTRVPGFLVAGETSDGGSCYYVRCRGESEIEVVRLSASGSFTVILTTDNAYSFTDGDEYIVGIEITATELILYAEDLSTPSAEVEVGRVTDSTWRGEYFGWRHAALAVSDYGGAGEPVVGRIWVD